MKLRLHRSWPSPQHDLGLETVEYAALAGMIAALGAALIPTFSDALAGALGRVSDAIGLVLGG